MAEFIYQEPFPIQDDKTKYRLLTKEYVKVVECDGRKILKVDPKGLELLSKEAYADVSFYLRAAHLQKLRNILEAVSYTHLDVYKRQVQLFFRPLVSRRLSRVMSASSTSSRFRRLWYSASRLSMRYCISCDSSS